MSTKTSLVVGASRGIGLGLVKKLVSTGHTVHATVRTSIPTDLATHAQIKWHTEVECTSPESLKKLAEGLSSLGAKLDSIYYVSGVYPANTSFPTADAAVTDYEEFFKQMQYGFDINTLAPLRAFSALQTFLAKSGKFGILTTKMGSIQDNTSGGSYAYRTSKTALNMAVKSLTFEKYVTDNELTILLLHPGWIVTDMTRGTGNNSVEQCCDAMVPIVENATFEKDNGRFVEVMREGGTLPW